MVNLEKWEEVEHREVKQGDRVKIVEVGADYETVYTADVLYVKGTDFYLSDGTVWQEEDDDVHDVTLYRLKPKPYEFPLGQGAVIIAKSEVTGRMVKFVRVSDSWISASSFARFTQNHIAQTFETIKTLSEGI